MPEVQEIRCYRETNMGMQAGQQVYEKVMAEAWERSGNHRQRYRASRLEEYQNRFHASRMKWLIE